LASFRKIDFFARVLVADGAYCRSPALQHGERAVKGTVGRHLVALDRRELGPSRLREHQAARAIEKRRLRPRGLPTAPRRATDDVRKEFVSVIPRRQGLPHPPPEALEAFGRFLGHRVSSRGEPMPQGIPARGCLARGRAGAGAAQGIAAVGGDLSDSGHHRSG
jgi:hypothetical protein